MSVGYFEFQINDASLKNYQKVECKWSSETKDKFLLAVSCYSTNVGGTIKVLDEYGILVEDDEDSNIGSQVPNKPGARVSAFDWHPSLQVLAIAWDNGDIGIYGPTRNRAKWAYGTLSSVQIEMQTGIKFLGWVSSGKQLVSVDMASQILIWKFDEANFQLTTNGPLLQISDDSTDIIINQSKNDPWLFIGSSSGIIHHVTVTKSRVNELIQCEYAVKKILFHENKRRLVIMTNNLMLYQFAITGPDEVNEMSRIKLSASSRSIGAESVSMEMIDDELGVIAICITGERVVRLWQLETAQNATIILNDAMLTDNNWSGVTCVDYSNSILSAGTSNSTLMIWKKVSGLEFAKIALIKMADSVKNICINEAGQIAVCSFSDDLFMIEEQTMSLEYKNGVCISQFSARQLKFFFAAEGNKPDILQLDAPIRDLWMDEDASCFGVKMSGAKSLLFYKINKKECITQLYKPLSLDEPMSEVIIKSDTVYYIRKKNEHLELLACELEMDEEYDFKIPLEEDIRVDDIAIISVDINGDNYVVTMEYKKGKFFYAVLQVSKLKISLKDPITEIETNERIKSVRINCDATTLAVVDALGIYPVPIGFGPATKGKEYIMTKNEVQFLFWATNEARMFCYREHRSDSIQIAIFSDEELIFKAYDVIEVAEGTNLLGFEVPAVILLEGQNKEQIVTRKSLSEFEGLNHATIKVMIDFLTLKSLDLNKMIKTMNQLGENNQKLWKNLARISVKCRDVEMGLYCVTKMRAARIAKDVKQEISSGQHHTALVVLAMNLDLLQEAEDILKQSEDKLALSNFYELTNEWSKAIQVCDSLNLKSVYYKYAKYLETEGRIQEAIKYYELSNTNVQEVPRMIYFKTGGDASQLEEYCCSSTKQLNTSGGEKNPRDADSYQLLHWWGMFCESQHMMEEALKSYESAKDYYNWIRILCALGDIDRAKDVLSHSAEEKKASSYSVEDDDFDLNDMNAKTDVNSDEEKYRKTIKGSRDAALLHLGMKLESSNPQEAIGYYLSCGAIKHAIRVCKAEKMINQLVKITVSYGSMDDARDLLSQGYFDSASDVSPESLVTLHRKSGQLKKAIEISLKNSCWTELREIISEIMADQDALSESNSIDESILKLSLESLRDDSEIIDIVIDLLLVSKTNHGQQELSLIENLLSEYNVDINDALIEKVEKIQQSKGSSSQLTSSLAEMSLKQGKYLIAAKLFNSMGDRINSLKSLIRSGQTDRVISYANIARDKLAYKIAANYLQTIDYSDRNIISNFYKKAGAKEELERFQKSINK